MRLAGVDHLARPADPHARAALIAAARQQFREHGIQKARIEDITAACGLSKGAFYLHFDSKEALFTEVVESFGKQMDGMFEERTAEEDAFFARRGTFRSRDFTERSARLDELEALQVKHDTIALELMWTMRDVIHVLMNGAQGTAFAGIIWHFVDREQKRVAEACDRLKKFGAVRGDVSANSIAKLLIGGWVLLMCDMVACEAKPDFSAVIYEMNQLLGEGLTPREPVRNARLKSSRPPAVSDSLRRTANRVSFRKASK